MTNKRINPVVFFLLGISPSLAGLVGHWKFDESSGTTLSDRVNENNGSWVPGIDATPDWRPSGGLLGGAVEFPGNGNHVNYFSINGFPSLNGTPKGMTISLWIDPQSTSGYDGILMTRTVTDNVGGISSGQNYGLAQESTHLDARVSAAAVDTPSGTLLGSTSHPAGSPAGSEDWFHIVWVWDNAAGTQKIFINGAQSGPTQTGSNQPANLDFISNGEWRIGDDACCNGRNFRGLMDDLAVWDEPLSEAAILNIYQSGLAGFAVGEAPQTDPLEVGLVINEIHYDPADETEPIEFIELLNTNSTSMDISSFSFTDGVSFTFPPGTMLDGMNYVIVTENATAFDAAFSDLPSGTQVFEFAGGLQNDGETIRLVDASGLLVDEVDYQSEFPWPISPNGQGDSMQLSLATLNNDLGGAWKGNLPTPGKQNGNFSTNSAPLIRQVDHSPKTPLSSETTTITAKVTDDDGVSFVNVLYQVVAPGSFIPAYLPNSISTVQNSPLAPQKPNPDFEDPANWTSIAMVDNGTNGDLVAGDSIYTATLPPQAHRTLVRYRIEASDTPGATIHAPFADDDSLNFAYFVYDGVPDYVAGETTYPAATLTTLPVYHMITRNSDREQAFAYASLGNNSAQLPKGNVAARKVYNWECALVFDGVVYDHIGWRLRQRNDRYAGNGKRSLRFRFNRGSYFQARDEKGNKLPIKWRRMNTSKMSRFGGTNSYGIHEAMNSKLWRMVGVAAPYFLSAHWRMIDDDAEAPDQYNGDFWGYSTVVQDIDGRLLDERNLPDGNMYKLKDGVTNPNDLKRNQSATQVTDGTDFLNVRNNMDSSQSEAWLVDHVDWDQWYRYHAVVEAVRHYDYGTPSSHFKNRAWYFTPGGGSFGRLRLIPHDHDASWSKGYHDSLNSVGNSIGTGFPWSSIFGGNTRPPVGPENAKLTRDYRNFIREFRQLLWQEETVNTMIDDFAANISTFSQADQDRWVGGPAAAGVERMTDIEDLLPSMKSMAFSSDTMYGSNLEGGRGAFLDAIATDADIPDQPVISYSGSAGFPIDSLIFDTTAFSDPQGRATFGALEWRIAEVTPAASPATDREFEWESTWTSGVLTTFSSEITPPAVATKAGKTYRTRVRHQDDTGRWSLWSEPVEFTATRPDLSLFQNALVISEIMYHPADPSPAEIAAGFLDKDDFEFIELRNVSDSAIDLSDLRFTKGVDFDFAGSAITSLPPDGYVLIVEDQAAFEFRYGAGLPIAGEWSGALNNGGEQLKLSFGAGEPVIDFIYDDLDSWPTAADGFGSSLVLVHPRSLPPHGNAFQWRPAAATPGTTDTTTFAGNTEAELLNYATNGDPGTTVILPDGRIQFEVLVTQIADDIEGSLQLTHDLNDWDITDPIMTLTNVTPESRHFARLTFTSATAPTGPKLFVRYRVQTVE
ncbi:MAG: lamin tail domain-containing protein [Akkermansiaceae bacterium]